MPIQPASVVARTVTSALGRGCAANVDALWTMRPGLTPCTLDDVPVPTWVGAVAGLDGLRLDTHAARECADAAPVAPLTGSLADFDCRNNRLAQLALAQDDFDAQVQAAIEHHGPARIGLFLGTSTAGIRHSEHCYRLHFERGTPDLGPDLRFDTTLSNFSLAAFVRRRLGLRGPAMVIATACSSGAKAFAAAHRSLSAGVCDAAVVGAVDTLCATTLMGFNSLGLLAEHPCTPWGAGRTGISIGEAAGFALLSLAPPVSGRIGLLGYGESSDAHHITAPHPTGAGAKLAMEAALRSADMRPDQVDYISLHGTGTQANDQSEDHAVAQLFGNGAVVGSIKGWTGHTLGASGAVEAVLSMLCLEHGLVPGTLNTTTVDPDLMLHPQLQTEAKPIRHVLSNAFGFGGNNCSLLFGRC
jgi:3-oxoacyl-[acyl-carrier-protein] synthase-1